MKKKISLISKFFLIVIVLFVNSCKKETDTTTPNTNNNNVNPTVNPTELQISISNNGNFVNGASVTLYESENDFNNKTSPVATKTTNSSGDVLFSNLKEIQYFYYAKKNCDVNQYTFKTTSVLTPNTKNYSSSGLYPLLNTIYITNNKDEQYYCYMNGSYKGAFDAYSTYSIKNLPDGTYNFEFSEVSYVFSQTKYTGTITVSCGEAKTITFG